MIRPLVILTAALALGCAGVQMPEPPSLAVGQRVRVTTPAIPDRRLTGTVVAMGDEALTLQGDEGPPVEVVLADVTSLSIQAGRRTRAKEGMLMGLGLGLGSFIVIDAAEGGCSGGGSGGLTPVSCESARALGLVVLTGGGLLVGTLVGSAFRTDRWVEQPLPLNVGLRLREGQVTLGWLVPVGTRPPRR